jgi:hypothetical protein
MAAKTSSVSSWRQTFKSRKERLGKVADAVVMGFGQGVFSQQA